MKPSLFMMGLGVFCVLLVVACPNAIEEETMYLYDKDGNLLGQYLSNIRIDSSGQSTDVYVVRVPSGDLVGIVPKLGMVAPLFGTTSSEPTPPEDSLFIINYDDAFDASMTYVEFSNQGYRGRQPMQEYTIYSTLTLAPKYQTDDPQIYVDTWTNSGRGNKTNGHPVDPVPRSATGLPGKAGDYFPTPMYMISADKTVTNQDVPQLPGVYDGQTNYLGLQMAVSNITLDDGTVAAVVGVRTVSNIWILANYTNGVIYSGIYSTSADADPADNTLYLPSETGLQYAEIYGTTTDPSVAGYITNAVAPIDNVSVTAYSYGDNGGTLEGIWTPTGDPARGRSVVKVNSRSVVGLPGTIGETFPLPFYEKTGTGPFEEMVPQ